MKKIYFGTNLKMYKNIAMTEAYLKSLTEATRDISRREMELFVLPSFTALPGAVKETDRGFVKLGAQNMNWEDEGQFTGDISPLMLKELGLDLVMIGHSERRHVFGETDIQENKKVLAALGHGFTALLCIGETGEEKEYGVSRETVRRQLKIGLHGVTKEEASKVWVAYEPVWSIGVNGNPASPAYAQSMHEEIKKTLEELFGQAGRDIPVLYGGSVKEENAPSLIRQKDIDGLFVGRAAWEAEKFNQLIRKAM